jgi:hypothetical protein
MGTASFPGAKRPVRPPLLAPNSRECIAVPLTPLWAFGSVTEYRYLFKICHYRSVQALNAAGRLRLPGFIENWHMKMPRLSALLTGNVRPQEIANWHMKMTTLSALLTGNVRPQEIALVLIYVKS